MGIPFLSGTLNISSLNSNLVGQVFIGNRSSILFVDQDASGNGDGTSWANAYTDLGEALTSNNMFDEVWVAEGTYQPGEIRASFFLLPPNISVYGGFSGTETLRSKGMQVRILPSCRGILECRVICLIIVIMLSCLQMALCWMVFWLRGMDMQTEITQTITEERGQGFGLMEYFSPQMTVIFQIM